MTSCNFKELLRMDHVINMRSVYLYQNTYLEKNGNDLEHDDEKDCSHKLSDVSLL